MKKTFFILILLIFPLILFSAFLASCGREEPEPPTVNWSDYAVVVPVSGVRQDSVSAYNALLAKIRQETGKNPEIRHETDEPVKNEILIDCDRDEFYEPDNLVRKEDALIRFTGDKFIVAAGYGREMLSDALYELAGMISADNTFEAGELYRINGKYPYDSVTVNGVELGRYVIVLPSGIEKDRYFDSNLFAQNRFDDKYLAALRAESWSVKFTGWKLRVIQPRDYDPGKYPYAFLFGNCGGLSEGMALPEGYYSYAIKTDGRSVAFSACDALTGWLAVGDYLTRLLPVPDEVSSSYDILLVPGEETGTRRPGEAYTEDANTRVLTFCGDYFSTDMGISWYFNYFPDIMFLQQTGLQYRHQLDPGTAGSSEDTLANRYSVSGTEPLVICWLKSRYTEQEKGNIFYISGTSSKKTVANWSLAYDTETGKRVLAVNFDLPEDAALRREYTDTLLASLNDLLDKYGADTKVIAAGECGTAEADPSAEAMGKRLNDAIGTARIPASSYFGTYHEPGSEFTETTPRDKVYLGDGITSVSAIRLFAGNSLVRLSHLPVICDMILG
ncbi:MAG: hypothetical protein K5647_08055 [Clostridiales bacterium]|nr:hypothetical protein [Clostridiales bacterium]